MANKQNTQDELDKVNEVLSSSEQFIENNQKRISLILCIIILCAAVWIGVRYFYFEPREKAAYVEMFKGEFYLDTDSFNLALNGNGADYIGFKAIVEDYSHTDAANLAAAYAGICEYNLGNYAAALDYFQSFKADDKFVSPNVLGMMGNCYANMDRTGDAIATFEKAAKKADNILLSPYYLQKAATVAEAQGDYNKALSLYRQIKDDYATSAVARDIDKYIERAQAKI